MKNNKRYMLIAQTETGFYEINWTKLKNFRHLEEEKYLLHFIDMFTKNYSNKTELLLELSNQNIISPNNSDINIRILPFIEQDGKRIFDSNPLIGEVIFKDSYDYLYSKDKIMSIIPELIKEHDFCILLQNQYLESDKYSYNTLSKVQSELENYEALLLQEPDNNQLIDIYNKKLNEFSNIQSIYTTLVNILLYNEAITNEYEYSENQYNDIIKSIYEFIIRELFFVTKKNSDGSFEFLKDENGYNIMNFEQTHNLCMLIQEYQYGKKKPNTKILHYKNT